MAAPKKVLGGDPLQGRTTMLFLDHTGQQAVSAYWGRRPSTDAPILPPQWNFQVYVTFGASADSDSQLPDRLLSKVRQSVVEPYPTRLDVIFLPGADTNQCIEHYRAAKAVRRAEPFAMIDPYHEGRSHMSLLLQIESSDWETNGATSAAFDMTSDYDDEGEAPRTNIERSEPWRRVAETMHSLAGSSGQDELDEAYQETLAQGRSDWA